MATQVAYYEAWRDLLRSWGFTVHEAARWKTRDAASGRTYLPGRLYVEHLDASSKLSGNWGALNYILSNRLANIVVARDGQITLCAAGPQNHAGVGSRPSLGDVPANGANWNSLGNEVANSGSEAYDPRCTLAIIATEAAWAIVSGRVDELERIIGHKEWADPPGRKTDPSLDMNTRRRQVGEYLSARLNQAQPTAPAVVAAIPELRYPVIGAIRTAYDRPGVASQLGQPLEVERATTGSDAAGRYQHFERGFLFWHPEIDPDENGNGRAHAVIGAISGKWSELGREVYTGFPITDELGTPDGVGRYNHFTHVGQPQGASIYHHPVYGSHVVKGAIRTAWAALGWEVGYGYPVTDEEVTGDGRGRVSYFSGNRAIVWSPETGVEPIHGAFLDAWEASSGTTGTWGYPTTGQYQAVDVQAQDFQNGRAFQARDGSVFFTPNTISEPPPETPAEVPVVTAPAEQSTIFGLPVPKDSKWRVSSPFGPRNGKEHRGIDIAAPAGTPLLAMGDGVVTTCRVSGTPKSGFGFVIVVRHERGGQIVDTVQGHMLPSSVKVKVGDKVKRGDQLAEVGAYGDAKGPHTHAEVVVGGWYAPGCEWVDPAPWLGL